MIEKIKTFIKDYFILFLSFIVIYIIFFIKLPYTISTTGGLINLNDRIDGYNPSGSLNMAYVNEIDANIFTYLVSMINKKWDIEKSKINKNDEQLLGKLLLNYSSETATIVAYNLANKEIQINGTKLFVAQITEDAKTDLKINDQIISINGIKLNEKNDIFKITEQFNFGDKINIKVVNNKKEYNRTAEIIEINNTKKIGIVIIPKYNLNENIILKSSEFGSSGGMMMTLAIYDYLTNEDLTKGRIIAGTGTISEDGEVGEIAGVKYKLSGAIKEKAEIFLVASENYNEAIKLKKENNYNIEIVKISNIKEAIEYLKK